MLEAVEAQLLGSSWVGVNSHIGVKPEGTDPSQVQLESYLAFHLHCWGVQSENPAVRWEKRQGRVPPSTPTTAGGWARRGSMLAALGLLLGLQGLRSLQSCGQETDVDNWSISTIPNLCISDFPISAPPCLPLLPYWSH